MKNYVIDLKTNQSDKTAQYKAKNDISRILTEEGFEYLPYYFYDSRIMKALSVLKLIHKINKVKNGFLIYQFPLGSKHVDDLILSKIKQNDAVKKIAFIHDIESLRNYSTDKKHISLEIQQLNQFDGLIVHTTQMETWLKSNGVSKPMVVLQLFDYLDSGKIDHHLGDGIAFAGNLKKADFLRELDIDTKFNIYGPNNYKRYPDNIRYMGSYSSNELVNQLKGSYGLIWDGTSVNECDGVFGNYEKYNSPHKLSLYLSTGMPVIVWRQAAVSKFVEENKIGLVIDSLKNLDEILKVISSENYNELKLNAIKVSKKLNNGFYTNTSVRKIINELI